MLSESLVKEALDEAAKRYPEAIRAISFLSGALVLSNTFTDEEIEWAKGVVKNYSLSAEQVGNCSKG